MIAPERLEVAVVSLPAAPAGATRLARLARASSDLALPIAWVLWGIGVSSVKLSKADGTIGLLAAMPPIFYLGIAVLVCSLTYQLVRGRLSPLRLGLHVVSLVVMVQGVFPILYNEPRFYWVFKTMGETQFDIVNGSLNFNLDIYQHWPGFFALTGWFDQIAGVANPIGYTAWLEVVVDLLYIASFAFALSGLDLDARQRWLAVVLFWTADWVATSGQDTFAPQALGLMLSFLVLGVALRWLRAEGPRRPVVPAVIGLVVYLGMLVSHPLSPYVVLIQLVVLAVLRRVNVRWFVGAIVLLGGAYLLLNLPYLNSQYHVLSLFGKAVARNVSRPGSGGPTGLGPNHTTILLSTAVLGVAAFAGALRRRARGREWKSLVGLALSPLVFVVAVSYGTETSMRVLLFSSPWLGTLAALAVWPGEARAVPSTSNTGVRGLLARGSRGMTRNSVGTGQVGRRWLPRGVIVAGLGALLLFMTASTTVIDYSQMELNAVSTADVQAISVFDATAQPGVAFSFNGYSPGDPGARYGLFVAPGDFIPVLTETKFAGKPIGTMLPQITQYICSYETPTQPYSYLLFSKAQARLSDLTGTFPKGAITQLWKAIRVSPDWRVFYQNSDDAIYENTNVGCGTGA
ncbi:MAG: hypothetical protein JWM85_2986 [Acidimicrobiaceae bacterium]|nr:hypothetical protein [Acidimicrobiaceae bacterium]